MIKILRQDKFHTDRIREFTLELNLNEDCKGYVVYRQETPFPTESNPNLRFFNEIKSWSCDVERPLIPFRPHRGWIYTLSKAIIKGNKFYDQSVAKYASIISQSNSLEQILDSVQKELQSHGMEIRDQLR